MSIKVGRYRLGSWYDALTTLSNVEGESIFSWGASLDAGLRRNDRGEVHICSVEGIVTQPATPA